MKKIMRNDTIYYGDVCDVLRAIPDNYFHCSVTSPPYWSLRDYQVEGQIGREETLPEYIDKMVEVFRELRRVLRPDGVFWLNIGDCFSSSGGAGSREYFAKGHKVFGKTADIRDYVFPRRPSQCKYNLKTKELCGIPWRLALRLSEDGWYLRSAVVWCKTNFMPDSAEDRPARSYELIFQLTKNHHYFYDKVPTLESYSTPKSKKASEMLKRLEEVDPDSSHIANGGRNMRDVWILPTATLGPTYKHCAVFPEALVEPCILSSTSEYGCCAECGAPYKRIYQQREKGIGLKETIGWKKTCSCSTDRIKQCRVLDPFMGSGTTAVVANKLGRKYVGIELSLEYIKLAYSRIYGEREGKRKLRKYFIDRERLIW